jgi:Cu+-exporting ATPase
VTEQTFQVQEIHCTSCEQAIHKSLTRLGGVHDVAADHRTNAVRVTFDERELGREQIAARLGDAGYPVVQ